MDDEGNNNSPDKKGTEVTSLRVTVQPCNFLTVLSCLLGAWPARASFPSRNYSIGYLLPTCELLRPLARSLKQGSSLTSRFALLSKEMRPGMGMQAAPRYRHRAQQNSWSPALPASAGPTATSCKWLRVWRLPEDSGSGERMRKTNYQETRNFLCAQGPQAEGRNSDTQPQFHAVGCGGEWVARWKLASTTQGDSDSKIN